VAKKRHDFTKSEREYVKGIVHNLSLQRLTDQEIVQWLHDEKKIDLDRNTVSKMRNHVELKAEKWYIELKQSTFKYIAIYKERIDSLFSCQKKLHEIISATKKPEVQIRAITELHSIEMSIFGLWKQLPALDIVDTKDNKDDHNCEEYQHDNVGPSGLPRAISYGPEEDERLDRKAYFGWKEGDGPLDACFKASMDEKYGLPTEPWDDRKWIQCPSCNRWFKNTIRLEMHAGRYCIPEPIV
jgi:hypothetical protein